MLVTKGGRASGARQRSRTVSPTTAVLVGSTGLHRFTVMGRDLLYSVDTCRLFAPDRATWEIMEALDAPSPPEALAGLRLKYGAPYVDGFLADLDEVRRAAAPVASPEAHVRHDDEVTFLRLHVSGGCNLRCRYCYAAGALAPAGGELMDQKTAERAVDFLMEHSGEATRLTVQFFGGEPLLNFPVMRHTVRYTRARAGSSGKDVKFYIFTNCLSLTPEMMGLLVEEDFDVAVSLDGPPEVHDTQRPVAGGQGSYARVESNALALLGRMDAENLFARGTFTRENYDITAMVMHLVRLGFRSISVQHAVLPAGHGSSIRPEDVPLIEEAYSRFAREYLDRLLAGDVFYFLPLCSVLRQAHYPRPSLLHCEAGRGSLAVSPAGEIYPCHELVGLDGYGMGNVFNGRTSGDIAEQFGAGVGSKPRCRGCWARYLCGGGCPAHAVRLTGSVRDPCELDCRLMRHRLHVGMWLYSVLADQSPGVLTKLVGCNDGMQGLRRDPREMMP